MRWPLLFCSSLLFVASAWGQSFEVLEPNGQIGATIEIERGRLLVYERTGERLFFSREQRYDSADGTFLGYFNFELNRVLRFPRSGQGKLQIADLDGVAPQFRYTRRIVRPSALNHQRGAGTRPSFASPHGGLWNSGNPFPNTFWLNPNDHRGQFPITTYGQPTISGFRYPQSVLIDTKIIPNPPLPPVRVELLNGGRREIQVGVVDFKIPGETRTMRIQPGAAVEMEVARDSGANQIESYRTVTPLGDFVTREIVRPIPASIRYEVVVHEWSMQSIAIDRTGKSPNAIEDINFQGRGLGRFPLPPGQQLQAGTIDVYRAAVESGNQGTVAPIVAGEDPNASDQNATALSPLERAILEAQRAAQRSR